MKNSPRTGTLDEFFATARQSVTLGIPFDPKKWTSRSRQQLDVFLALDKGTVPPEGALDANATAELIQEGLVEGAGTPADPYRFTERGQKINYILFKSPYA